MVEIKSLTRLSTSEQMNTSIQKGVKVHIQDAVNDKWQREKLICYVTSVRKIIRL